jgi:hypothetical protein
MGNNFEEWFGVRTGEGGGVIHLVYAGKSVRYHDLKTKWQEYTGSWVVSIRKVREPEGMIREICLQHKKVRYFHSRNWATAPKTIQQDFDKNLKKEWYFENKMQFKR